MPKEPGLPVQPSRIPRRDPRAPLYTKVESQTSHATVIGLTDNISVGGLLVLCGVTFEPSTEVIVRFDLPPRHNVETQGVVVHAQPGLRMGIQFHQLKDEYRKAIAQYVQQSRE